MLSTCMEPIYHSVAFLTPQESEHSILFSENAVLQSMVPLHYKHGSVGLPLTSVSVFLFSILSSRHGEGGQNSAVVKNGCCSSPPSSSSSSRSL